MKESLGFLGIENHPATINDVSFASAIQIFRNLVRLDVDDFCHGGDDD